MNATTYAAALAALTASVEGRVEYEESHDDAGSGYAHIPRETGAGAYAEKIREHLAKNGRTVTPGHAREIAREVLNADAYEMEPGSVFGPYESAGRLVLDSFAVGEVEDQYSYADACRAFGFETEAAARAFFARVEEDGDHCARVGHSDALIYTATDAVWFATITTETLREIAEETAETA